MATRTLRRGLYSALKAADHASRISCFGVLESFPDPDLFIQGLGVIGLPLSTSDAQAIAQSNVTKQSPFGKGTETVVDTSVRKSWQIDPLDFQLRDPAVDARLQIIVSRVCNKLGVGCDASHVSPQLYKLLLYEEGAFFRPHQDGEKVKGMFGTLMICLPSAHTGGELELSHEGRCEVVRTATTSKTNYSFAAWYSDVSHEIKPILGGNRLVLIYNLVQTAPGASPIAPPTATRDAEIKLREVLSMWQAFYDKGGSDHVPGVLAYKLSHKYSTANLSFSSLKGNDHSKFHHLKVACASQNFRLLLAHIKKKVHGECEDLKVYVEKAYHPEDPESSDHEEKGELENYHSIISVLGSRIRLTRVIDDQGAELGKDIPFDVKEIVQANLFHRRPDKENFEGYTGNDGVETTHFYHETVVLVIPDKCFVEFRYRALRQTAEDVVEWIARLRRDSVCCSDGPGRLELEELCDLIINDKPELGISLHQMLNAVAMAALELNDLERVSTAINLLGRGAAPEAFATMRDAIARLGFDHVKPALESAFARLGSYYGLHPKWSALLQLAGGASATGSTRDWDAQPATVREWSRARLNDMLANGSPLGSEDGAAVAQIAGVFGSKVLDERILPLVETNVFNIEFTLTFLSCLFRLRGSDQLPTSMVESIYIMTVENTLTKLALHHRKLEARYDEDYYGPCDRNSLKSPQLIMETLQVCEKLSLQGPISRLVKIIDASTSFCSVTDFETVLLPNLTLLLAHLREHDSVSILGIDCSDHVYRILQSYLKRMLDPVPAERTDWTCSDSRFKCGCEYCDLLRNFITDSTRRTTKISLEKSPLSHLEWQVRGRPKYLRYKIHEPGKLHTLIITKADPVHKHQMHLWRKRFKTAQGRVQELDLDPWLKRMLGEKHERVVSLACRDDDPLPPPTPESLPRDQSPEPGANQDRISSDDDNEDENEDGDDKDNDLDPCSSTGKSSKHGAKTDIHLAELVESMQTIRE